MRTPSHNVEIRTLQERVEALERWFRALALAAGINLDPSDLHNPPDLPALTGPRRSKLVDPDVGEPETTDYYDADPPSSPEPPTDR